MCSLLDLERYQTSCPSRYARHLTRGFKGEYSEVNRMPCVFGRNPQRNKQCQMLRNDTRVINPHWLWDNRGMLFKAGGTGNEPWRIDCDANNCTTQEEGNDRKQIRLSVFRKALQCPFKQTNIRTVLNLPAYYLSLDFRAWRVGVYKVKCCESESCQEWGRETVTSLLTQPKLERTDGRRDMPIVGSNAGQWTREDDPVWQPGMSLCGLGTKVKGGHGVPCQLTALEWKSPASSLRCTEGSGLSKVACDCFSRWEGAGSQFPGTLSVFAWGQKQISFSLSSSSSLPLTFTFFCKLGELSGILLAKLSSKLES